MKRREFLKTAGFTALGAAVSPQLLAPRHLSAEMSIYDPGFFECAERFAFLSAQEAVVSLLVRPGRTLDIKFYKGPSEASLVAGTAYSYTGVKDVLDISLAGYFWGPAFYYKLEYRDSASSSGWRTTPVRRVKTPRSYLERGRMEIILLGDDHTYDDADTPSRGVWDPSLRASRLNGEYVNDFLRILQSDPSFVPDEGTDLGMLRSGFSLASAIYQIMTREDPDLIIHLGDATGIGAGYKWPGLGLKDPELGLTSDDRDAYAKLFWLRMRRMYSALTPYLPLYLVQGNHDGESGYGLERPYAVKYRTLYFPQPGGPQGQSIDQNYFALAWGGSLGPGNPLFIILDNEGYNTLPPPGPLRPEDWTLGLEQKDWLRRVLDYESDWKFTFFHHVLGGWPGGSNEAVTSYSYGRGPLYTAADYAPYCSDPEKVEQVGLTRLLRDSGVRCSFYGHDHIFFGRKVEGDLKAICVGSPKPVGELAWYKGPLWIEHYGCRGRYGREEPVCSLADFWGPSGYAKLTLTPSSAVVEYKRASDNNPWTNIPSDKRPGDILRTINL
jgi:3',5'-cyclic AMP phosphodiesterase CpdA